MLARITDLKQIRAIAHPLRMRMLQLFAEEPLTTKQVADRLGEKPTRLYNHSRALERAGLVKLVGTKRNRGTTERYLQAVGSRFEIDEALLQVGRSRGRSKGAAYASAAALLRGAARDLDVAAAQAGEEPLVTQASLRLTPRQYERLRARVMRWMKELERDGVAGQGNDATVSALLTVALTPKARGRRSARGSRSRGGRS